MRPSMKCGVIVIASLLAMAGAVRAQEMKMPAQEQGHPMQMTVVRPEYPRMSRAQENAKGALFTLEQAEKIAGEANPTLRQTEAEIRASKARLQQSGLYPNPTVAYTGDEIRGGSVGGGKQGFFVQQTMVTGGKLGLSREVFAKDVKLAEIEAEEQKMRVQSAVKMAFLRVLAAQELLDARRDMAAIAQDSTETQRRLMNTGQADETEVLEAEVEAQRMRMGARMQENTLREEWRSLAAVIGQPGLPLATVAGDLEKGWPEVNEEEAVEAIAKESPAVRIADVTEARAQNVFSRARREAIPDVQVRGGMEYNHELLGSVPFAKGWEGIAEVAVEIPLFNRNQGVGVSRGDAPPREKGLRVNGGEVWPDAGVVSPRVGRTAEALRIADRVHRRARKRLDQRHRATRVLTYRWTRSTRTARRSRSSCPRNECADAGTHHVAPGNDAQPLVRQ